MENTLEAEISQAVRPEVAARESRGPWIDGRGQTIPSSGGFPLFCRRRRRRVCVSFGSLLAAL